MLWQDFEFVIMMLIIIDIMIIHFNLISISHACANAYDQLIFIVRVIIYFNCK
jgi:hypothetical protein